MSICWLQIGDGRDAYHELSHRSMTEHLPLPDFVVTVDDRDHELGFAGAIQEGWRQVIKTGADWVFHAELDFTYNAPVPVERMRSVLKRHPKLMQLVLKRQPWNPEEKAAGGIVEQHPDDYTEIEEHGDVWTEHRRFFSTNPSLYSSELCHRTWPQTPESEGIFTHELLGDQRARFAFWGGKFDPPLVHHIGDLREGTGY